MSFKQFLTQRGGGLVEIVGRWFRD